MKPVRPLLLLLALIGWASVISSPAASGTWTNRNGGSWTNAANWNATTIADGSGNTANFTTLNLSSDVTMTLDGPRTIGNLNFDDQNSTKHNWSLNAGSGGPLTLAGSTPTFTVLSATTSVSVAIGGTAGLTKAGAGKLVLNGANTYSGTTMVNAGILGLPSTTLSATSPLNIAAAGASVLLLVTCLIPVPAILLGALVLGERLEPRHYAGMARIGLGLAIIDGRIAALLRPAK